MTGPRPEVLAVVAVENGALRFTLAADGAKGRDMREAMAEAAGRYGMPVALPGEALAADAGVDDRGLEALRGAAGADVALAGTLAWSGADLAWNADWRLVVGGRPYRWSAYRVSFDDAFRAAIGGAAQILSGQGAPD